jgi:hypothetical protein
MLIAAAEPAAVRAVANVCRRRKLPLLSVAQLDALLGPAGPQDALIAVCLLASWNPVCTKLEHYELQGAHYELTQQAAAAKHVQDEGSAAQSGSSGRDGSGDGSSSVKLGVDAAYIKVGVLQCSCVRRMLLQPSLLPVVQCSCLRQQLLHSRVEQR